MANSSPFPYWLGFVLMLIASVASILWGVLSEPPRVTAFVAFGVWGIVSTVMAWVSGGTSRPTGTNVGGIASVSNVVWIIVAVLFIAAAIVSIAIRTF